MFNEKEVVSSILKGNMQAFELLVKQYERLVFFVVNRLISNREDMEDICQEVFVKVHKSLHNFAFQSKLSTWIARIAYLTAINHLRKNKTERITHYPDDIENFHFTYDTPELTLTRKNTAEYVNLLIAQMPVQYRTVLTLYHLNEFSYQEIEEITGIPESNIKSHLFRGRKWLKEKIQQDLKDEQL
ncbi:MULTISPECIES: sigma-70 family RNA polymerase sigma factor [unclassified Mucilaginibacter]|uniref:RNA polymerase sigma factor n=1 Tax=unclassified Mucilaginibacter TaxID=2617802 RepID=UPI0031F632CF